MDSQPRRTALELPWRTILKVLATAALVWVFFQLTSLILAVVVAVLLAVTLDPVVEWLEARRVPRWAGGSLVALAILVTAGAFLWLTWSSLAEQAQFVGDKLTSLTLAIQDRFPWLGAALGTSDANMISGIRSYLVGLASSASSAAGYLFLGFVLTIYLLMEGQRTFEWVIAFVPLQYRPKMRRTLAECRQVVFGYVAGNVMTSVIATVVTLIALRLLKVPAALFLAIIAGLSDFVPVVGFIVSSIPAVVLALTVSPNTALLVVLVYIAYNSVETYILSPWAYGGRMKLSNVAVILAFVAGAELAGVVGALIALPCAAIYPIVERYWLRDQLPEETVREHRAIETKAS